MSGERQRLESAGAAYEKPYADRVLPDLPAEPQWQDVLRRAFLANGDLEAAYTQWQAAMSRVEIASEYPNSRVGVGFDYMFSDENLKAWDRTTVNVGFDPSMMLQFPTKVAQAGQVAFEEARMTGYRFLAAKFELQTRVLTAWWDYTLLAERVRLQQSQVDLLRMLKDSAAERLRQGGSQPELLRADTDHELALNEWENLRSEQASMRALLNGMLARPSDAPLPAPTRIPDARAIPVGDDVLIAAAVDENPELAALAHEVAGRSDAVELARMAYIPDIVPQFSFTGSVSQAVGAMVMLPTTLRQIRASIEEARARLRGTEAMLRQARFDRASRFVATLVALRNEERQVAFLERSILVNAEQVQNSVRSAYSVGAVSFAELIDSQRLLLEVRVMSAEARVAREKRLAELEQLAGLDVETLAENCKARLAAGELEAPNHD